MFAVDIDTDPELLVSVPDELFNGNYLPVDSRRQFDVAPDGRFLMLKLPDELMDPS